MLLNKEMVVNLIPLLHYFVSEGYLPTYTAIETKSTLRNFLVGEFKDVYGGDCSIQEASTMEEHAIWLGYDDIYDLSCVARTGDWELVKEPEKYMAHTRMQLNQDIAKSLIPLLQHFVDTGELPTNHELIYNKFVKGEY